MSRSPDLVKREAWRRRLAAYARGTLTVEEFCRRAGVSVASFYQWRRKLGDERGGSSAASGGWKNTTRRSASASGFLPVEITGLSLASACIEVLLPGGPKVRVPCHEPQAIRTVIAALADVSAALAKIAMEDRTC
jgi:transposase-like protein